MLALHAAWTCDDLLALWAEDATRTRVPRRGRPRKTDTGHPFAADLAALEAALAGLRPGVEAAPESLEILLPSAADTPTPSPWLWLDEPAAPPTRLASWTVPALLLGPDDALDLLLTLSGGTMSDSVGHLAQVARFAVELATRGMVVPALVRTPYGWEARWRAFTADPGDAARRATLARGAPPLLGACDVPEGAEDVGVPASDVVGRALDTFVDAFARGALRGSSLVAGPPRRTPEDAWLSALTAPDATLPDGLAGVDALAAKLDAWARAPMGGAADGFRTCFRLTEPEAEGPWRLDFLLQAADDPSLQVPAAEVWKTRGRALALAGRSLAGPQEKLLRDLGRAATLAPAIAPALDEARPDGVDLDAAGAWAFLREGAALLAQAGFGVMAPAFWGRPGARLGVRMQATPKDATNGGMGLDAICAFRWEVALGDETLSAAELRRIAAMKAPLVRVRGRWVEVRPEDVAAALAFYEKREASGEMTARDALRSGLGLEAPRGGLPVVGLSAAGWLGEVLDHAREGTARPLPAPPGFGATLRPYQERGLGWLAFLDELGLGACLADDMGLGKTVQLLALLARERFDGARPPPTLLVCPMSLVGNWQREATRFAPDLRVLVHHGAGRRRTLDVADVDLVLTTYALADRDAKVLGTVKWGRLVLDEAQNIKNAGTRQAKAVHGIAAPRRVALTGTPVENRLSELWSILEFLNPGLLGSATSFRERFAIPVERYGDDEAAASLRRVTSPFVLRRLKTDKAIVPDLPDKLEMKVLCNLTREQATLYQAVVDELMGRVDGLTDMERRGAVLAAMTKLKQVCDHPALLLQDRSALPGRSGKLALLEELLAEIVAGGERALVFTQFTQMGHPLKAHLQERLGREVLFLHGGTTREARDAMVARFGAADGPPVFLLSLKAGGTGLNLVAANHVVHFDRWWNPAVEDQATDRAFRIGQRRDVQVRKLVCVGTLEERIDRMIEDKRSLARKVVGTGEAWLADLSTSALRDLLALSRDAVAED